MNNCLWCHEKIIEELNWSTIFVGNKSTKVCAQCYEGFSFINQKRCRKCFKKTSVSPCDDCRRWDKFYEGRDPLKRNIATFTYNNFMKAVIAKWKYRGDFELIHMFSDPIKKSISTYFHDILKKAIIVPIPLSDERLQERGFNQASAIAHQITRDKNKVKNILVRVHNEKQSKKNRFQRIYRKNPFKLRKKTNKTVILVDDIYTTGTTLRHAASLLKQKGCPAIYSYSLIRG